MFEENYIGSKATLQILETIAASHSIKTLKSLNMMHCHWNEVENCKALANLLARTINMTELWINDRRVK